MEAAPRGTDTMKHAHIPLRVLCAALLVCAHLSVFLALAAPVSVWLPVLLGLTAASFAASLLAGRAVCCPRCGHPIPRGGQS